MSLKWEHYLRVHSEGISKVDPFVRKLISLNEKKPYIPKSPKRTVSGPWTSGREPPVEILWHPNSKFVDGSSILPTIILLWPVATHLLDAFKDTW